MVPEGQNKAASLPKRVAAFASSVLTEGSVPKTSSPTSASIMAASIGDVGFVIVSEIKLIINRLRFSLKKINNQLKIVGKPNAQINWILKFRRLKIVKRGNFITKQTT